jgi:hypothetical protein
MNHFNICPSCINRNDCALTAQKDKVWSCSEFDHMEPTAAILKKLQQPERTLALV